MRVPVMQVGIMRMLVPQRLMAVPMGVRFRDFAFVSVLMMLVVHMPVLVFHYMVDVLMLVPFR